MTVPDPTPEGREFTPPMERLRDEYVQMRADHFGFADLYAAEFDRALAERDAQIKATALREAAEVYWQRGDVADRYSPWSWLRARAGRIEAGEQP